VFPWMRVLDNVAYGLRCRGVPRPKRKAVAEHYLAEVGLSHVAESWPKELSGGMRKRVAVATVFANNPDMLLMDEQFGALDYVTTRQLHALLLRLWAESDVRKTVLFVAHDVEESLTLADPLLVMNDGAVVEDRMADLPRPRT